MSKKKKTDELIEQTNTPILIETLEDFKLWLNNKSNKLNPMERVMATVLLLNDVHFYPQYRIDFPEGWSLGGSKYAVADFYIPSLSLIVETEGKIHLEEDVQRRDRNRFNFLTSMGYRILRFSWDEVMEAGTSEDFDVMVFISSIKK